MQIFQSVHTKIKMKIKLTFFLNSFPIFLEFETFINLQQINLLKRCFKSLKFKYFLKFMSEKLVVETVGENRSNFIVGNCFFFYFFH
jgi:hypothetical protein